MTTAESPVSQAIAKLKALRKGYTLGGLSWNELRIRAATRSGGRGTYSRPGSSAYAELQAVARAEDRGTDNSTTVVRVLALLLTLHPP